MFGFVFVFAFFCTDTCLVFAYCTLLMFALLVANLLFCNNKFDLI